MNEKSCFIMGLPEAGKTTYLATLWYCLNSKSETRLKISNYSGDLSYLSDIGNKWVNFQSMPRTKPEFEKAKITLVLKNAAQEIIEITFPDLSGESFQNQYVDRETSLEHVEYVKKSMGILLFINPLKIKEPQFISKIPQEYRNNENGFQGIPTTRNAREHDPTQVQLVELLQFVKFMRNEKPVNLGLIISAWDTVECSRQSPITPQEFIKSRLPLLWQYIDSNSKSFKTTNYGVSAQGGPLEDNSKLWDIKNPVDRIIIIDNDGNRSHDITLPLSMMVSETK